MKTRWQNVPSRPNREKEARLRIWRDLVARIRTASLEKVPASPLRPWEKRELVTYRRRRPAGPEKMSLPLQQMYAMTRDVKKT